MLLDRHVDDIGTEESFADRPVAAARRAAPRWTIVLPFYNERTVLPLCLESLSRQTMPFQLILVDNGSTDGSAEIARALCDLGGIRATLLTERRPGKVAALQSGIEQVVSDLVATCDADTIYPPDYLARATRLLDRPQTVAAVAATAAPEASRIRRMLAGLHIALAGRLLPQQCHNGGAGQVFRTAALKAAGSFDPRLWNWVLEDHEIMARVEQYGRIAYHHGFCCAPIERPRAASTVGWSLPEQLRYHGSNPASRIAFFHDFLGPRLRERSLSSECLRRDHQQLGHHLGQQHRGEKQALVDLYPVRG